MYKLFLLIVTLAVNANAMIMTLNLSWGFGRNIQEGSIVQVVAYRTGSGSAPTGGAVNNFEQDGEFLGLPYYDAESVVLQNHELIESFSVQENISGYFIFEQFEISYYNRIYLRIFEATNFDNSVESEWGLTRTYIIPQNGKPYTITVRDFELTDTNFFWTGCFEVIPDGNVLILVSLGFVFLIGVTILNRRKNARRVY